MANTKQYSIKINGLTESINAVDSLNKQLDKLEQRMKTLSSAKVSTGGGGSTKANSALSEEERTQKEINKLKQQGQQLDAKILAAQDEIYKRVDATKELYKETIADQKALAAQERLSANAYSNTMVGMKQQLADIKAVIQTTDLGDGDAIKKMTQQANELTNKLKDMEEAYGQFGRNVGNYKSAFDGLQKVSINVGGITREFNTAREASKTLNNELKAMAVNGQQNTKEFKELQKAVMEMESTMNDAKKPMDNLMDSMESVMAIANVGQGIRGLFGVDDAEMQKSIKNLLALQNVLKGIQSINKQLKTGEGIGAWIKPFNTGIEKATTKLLVFNRALLGTGTAGKMAAKGISLMSKALKGLASLGIILVIEVAIEKVMDLIESFNKLSEAEKVQKDVEEAMADAYGKGMGKLTQYKARLDSFNGSKKEEKKLVEELNKEFGDTLGTYKTIAEWQDVLDKKGRAYIETLKLQAKAQAALNAVTAAYANLMKVQMGIANGEYDGIWNAIFGKSGEARLAEAQKLVDDTSKLLEEATKEQEEYNKKNKLGDYAPQIDKNANKSKKALEEANKTLNDLELRLMREGLNKKLRQLDEEERQTINKLKENGRKSGIEIQKVQRAYNQLRANEIQDYLKKLEEKIRKSSKDIAKIKFEINMKDIEIQLDDLNNKLAELEDSVPTNKTLTSRVDLLQVVGKSSLEDRLYANEFNEKKLEAEATGEYDKFYKFLKGYLKTKNQEIKSEFYQLFNDVGEEQAYSNLAHRFEEDFEDALNAVRAYGAEALNYENDVIKKSDDMLLLSFNNRLLTAEKYYSNEIQLLSENIKKQNELNKEKIQKQFELDEEAERQRYTTQFQDLDLLKQEIEYEISKLKDRNDKEKELKEDLEKELEKVNKQMEDALKTHGEKMGQINEQKNADLIKSDKETYDKLSSIQEKYFDKQISNYRDFQSKLNDEISKNPVTDTAGFGIVNIAATRRNYKEIMNASNAAIGSIMEDKKKLDSLYSQGLIKPEVYNTTLSQLNDLEKEIKNGMAVTAEANKQLIGEFIGSINQYFQVIGQSIEQIMQSVWDYQDYMLEKEQDELDKWNDKLDKALDKQQEIVEEHKNAVDSIEDELATSRGDRRQHLIDQLNEQIAAQRAAQKEEQKIQKQKEAAEKKQEQLEKKRREEEYKRNVIQAFISWHMAIANGLATQPFMPLGIAMGALATVLGGIQYALVKSQKPYAKGGQLDGGVAQGKRHSEGGIPVLGGRASIEGGEFITNRQTTAKNVDLLEYINSKKKKVDLSDFIEFYSSGNMTKNISPTKRVFADGGQIPTLRNDIDINDRLLAAFEDYSNRNVVVSVVDINNRQEAVKNVQVLAGLDND